MNIIEVIRRRILKFLKLEKLDENPNGERFTFICDEDNIIKQKLQEYKMWYIGDSDELLNYYTNQQLYGNAEEPIYNRNKKNYFWGISTTEGDIKRVHSGIPNAIVTTLTNVIGVPTTNIADKELNEKLDKIKCKNNFENLLNQQQMPMTEVEGWGAFKVNIDKSISDTVMIQYYEAEDVEFVYKSGILVGIIYKDYYRYKNKDYVLLETRRIANGNSLVEYELFRMGKNNDVYPVECDEVPELANLKPLIIPNFNKILGVASKFFYDPINKNYGKSIFAGKIDLFDDLDQILSQDSQTVRVSTPVEYYPVDVLERQKNGQPKMPKVYNRQFLKKETAPNGDGTTDGTIQTTQPQLNFDQYSNDAQNKLGFILTGLLSPATMGIDIAKKDNADAQREKEKVTIMTRNNIINRETKIIKELLSLCLSLQEYLDTGSITLQDYDISVNFNEFANPSFESELQTLGPAWSDGQISTSRYVELLWGDKLSDEEKAIEVAWLDNNKSKDNFMLGDIEDANEIRTNLSSEEEDNIPIEQIK